MTTIWDPTTTGFAWSLSNTDLEARATRSDRRIPRRARRGAAPRRQRPRFSIDITHYVGVAVGIGLATAGHPPRSPLGDDRRAGAASGGQASYPPSTPPSAEAMKVASGPGSGRTIYVQVRNGFVYFAECSAGPWIGVAPPADPAPRG